MQRVATDHLLLLDTGDALIGGGDLGDLTQGEAIVAGMSAMEYDAMALGPNELSLGLDTLRARIAAASFPVLSANVSRTGSDDTFADPYVVLSVGSRRVAVIGLTRVPDAPLSDFEVHDPRTVVETYVPLVAARADTVILLTNLRYDDAKTLAGEVPGIDAVVAARPELVPAQPELAAGTGSVVLVADRPLPGHSGRYIGRLAATIEPSGSIAVDSWAMVGMTEDIPDDDAMTALLMRFENQ